MNVPDIIRALCNRFVEIEIHRSAVNEAAKEESRRLAKYLGRPANSESDSRRYISLQNMLFQDLTSGDVVRYGHRQFTAEDEFNMISKHKNRQYCWLLVEAYEEFEDFLERIYAYIGKDNRNAWRLEDFGSAKLPDLDHKRFDWFLNAVRVKYRLNHRNLLKRLREIYPELSLVEEQNIYQLNLRFTIETIENLRHHIVHTRGIVQDLDQFGERIIKKCGLWNNGNPKTEHKQLIERYFIVESGTCTIWLNERPIGPPEIPSISFHDTWSELIGYLVAYAYAIALCVNPEGIQIEWGEDSPTDPAQL